MSRNLWHTGLTANRISIHPKLHLMSHLSSLGRQETPTTATTFARIVDGLKRYLSWQPFFSCFCLPLPCTVGGRQGEEPKLLEEPYGLARNLFPICHFQLSPLMAGTWHGEAWVIVVWIDNFPLLNMDSHSWPLDLPTTNIWYFFILIGNMILIPDQALETWFISLHQLLFVEDDYLLKRIV